MSTPDHPLCVWLTKIIDGRTEAATDAIRLRASSEKLLLSRHVRDVADCCQYDGEPFPCLEWRAVASGWAHMPGFDPEWMPTVEEAEAQAEPLAKNIDALIQVLLR